MNCFNEDEEEEYHDDEDDIPDISEDEKKLIGHCKVCGSEEWIAIDKYEDETNIPMFSSYCEKCKKERFFSTQYDI